jgi:DNA polymerase sigma
MIDYIKDSLMIYPKIIDFTMNINKNKEFLQQIREKYIKKIYEIVNIILMDLKVDFLCSFYGSTISGLSIENSDIDILVKIKENKRETNYLKNIMKDLVVQLKAKNINFINNINPILSASVPVIKLECDLCNDESFSHEINTLIKKYDLSYNDITKLYFDITFFEVENEQNKIPSELMIDYIKESLMIYPKIIDIIYIMKKYLFIRKLNKSYQGGISSYSLFLLTLSFVKCFKNNYDLPIGSILIDYLSYYSNFDFYSTVIQPNKDDNIFSLIEGNSNFQQSKLNIIDPITGLNVAKSTFKIEQIKEAFAEGLNNIISNLYTINNNEKMNNINGHKKILDSFLAK